MSASGLSSIFVVYNEETRALQYNTSNFPDEAQAIISNRKFQDHMCSICGFFRSPYELKGLLSNMTVDKINRILAAFRKVIAMGKNKAEVKREVEANIILATPLPPSDPSVVIPLEERKESLEKIVADAERSAGYQESERLYQAALVRFQQVKDATGINVLVGA